MTITDRNPLPAQGSVSLNSHHIHPHRPLTVLPLTWGQDVSSEFHPPYDVILAADVVYIEDTFTQLLKSLDDLSDPNTTILLSCKYRYERDSQFLDLLRVKFMSDIVWSQGSLTIYHIKKKDH